MPSERRIDDAEIQALHAEIATFLEDSRGRRPNRLLLWLSYGVVAAALVAEVAAHALGSVPRWPLVAVAAAGVVIGALTIGVGVAAFVERQAGPERLPAVSRRLAAAGVAVAVGLALTPMLRFDRLASPSPARPAAVSAVADPPSPVTNCYLRPATARFGCTPS